MLLRPTHYLILEGAYEDAASELSTLDLAYAIQAIRCERDELPQWAWNSNRDVYLGLEAEAYYKELWKR